MKILIAEDEPISRKILGRALEKIGYEVIAVEDGLKAWEVFQKEEIHFIISDWEMPGMDGVSLCRQIRAVSRGWYCYIILITVKSEMVHLKRAFEAGADDYISKPFDIEELGMRVSTGERIVNLEIEHTRLADILIESRNKLKTVFDSMSEEIIVLDEKLLVTSANKPFVDNRRLIFNEIIGVSALELDGGLFNDESRKAVTAVFQTGKTKNFLLRMAGPGGANIVKDVQCLPVKNEAGNITQVVFTARDITVERNNAERVKTLNEELNFAMAQVKSKNEKLEDALRQIQEGQAQMLQSEKMASIGQLAAGVAHEINNPTGFVSSNLKSLGGYMDDVFGLIGRYQELYKSIMDSGDAEGAGSEAFSNQFAAVLETENAIDIDYLRGDVPELIRESREGMDRIRKIVMDLKDFAHPEDDKKYADINQCIESTLNIVMNEIKYKAKLEKSYEDIPPLLCYPRQLNQVILNLLVNAAQAITDQGIISIQTQLRNNEVRVVIRDTGTGIPPENLSKIFDPFFTTKPVGKGTGLGLNLVYNIIKKHGGTIQVESEVGKGTAFIIDLPVKTDADEFVDHADV